jgi:hypothetical protein
MRSLNIAVWVAAAILAMTVSLTQASALGIEAINVVYSENRMDGATAGYAVDFQVQGTGITDAAFKNINTGVTTPMTFNAGISKWEYGASFTNAQQAAFQSTFPDPANYLFEFNLSGSTYQDQVLLGYAVGEPSDYLHNTVPLMNATGVPLTPTYTWLPGALPLWALGERVRTTGGVPLYVDFVNLNVSTTSWTPGTLVPGSYQFILEDYLITGGQPINTSTSNGDAFVYYGLYGQSNQINFSTGFSTASPEPVSLMLFGSAAVALIGWRRRNRMK